MRCRNRRPALSAVTALASPGEPRASVDLLVMLGYHINPQATAETH